MTDGTRDRLAARHAEYRHAARRAEEEEEALGEAGLRAGSAATALAVVQATAEEAQRHAHAQLAAVVSRCLRACGFDYDFVVSFVGSRGSTAAVLNFRRGGLEVDPGTAAGGGAVDVASFALRLACLLLSRPARRRLLVLDESFKHLDRKRIPAVAALLEELCAELNLQILLVTHNRRLRVGAVVEVGEGA